MAYKCNDWILASPFQPFGLFRSCIRERLVKTIFLGYHCACKMAKMLKTTKGGQIRTVTKNLYANRQVKEKQWFPPKLLVICFGQECSKQFKNLSKNSKKAVFQLFFVKILQILSYIQVHFRIIRFHLKSLFFHILCLKQTWMNKCTRHQFQPQQNNSYLLLLQNHVVFLKIILH